VLGLVIERAVALGLLMPPQADQGICQPLAVLQPEPRIAGAATRLQNNARRQEAVTIFAASFPRTGGFPSAFIDIFQLTFPAESARSVRIRQTDHPPKGFRPDVREARRKGQLQLMANEGFCRVVPIASQGTNGTSRLPLQSGRLKLDTGRSAMLARLLQRHPWNSIATSGF
jgi:hypothetical protein